MATAEVSGVSGLCSTYQHNPDGSIQNKTKTDEATELESKWGKRSLKSLVATFWCDSEELRKAEFERVCKVWESSRWIFYGPIEWTEENKKPHVHVCISFKGSKLFKTLIKVLPSKIYHLGDDKGKQIEIKKYNSAKEYAWKENPDDVLEFGEMPVQGKRTDLKKLIEDNDHNITKIATECPDIYSRYRSGIEKCCDIMEQLDNFDKWCETEEIEVEYHLGTSRCGKTYALQQICKQIKKDGLCAWILQHLNGEFYKVIGRSNTDKNPEVIVLNEFRDSKMALDTFLELLEGKGTIPTKGGDINCIGIKKVLIASIIPPWELYNHSKRAESVEEELKGRIKDNLIYHDKVDGKYITKQIKWREIEDFSEEF